MAGPSILLQAAESANDVRVLMQLAVDEDRRVRKPDEGWSDEAEAGARCAGVTTGRVGITSGSLV